MYFHVRSKGDELPKDPEFQKHYHDTQDFYAKENPKDLSPVRRLAIKKMRYQGKTPRLLAEAKAIRDLMEREINR